jgi:membrane associated rhomboid family serine protease
MKQFGTKFKLIFLPFVVISTLTTIVYTFLRWALFIKFNSFTVDEDILDMWGPMALPWIPILIWLRPRIKLLNLKNKNGKGDPLMGYMAFAWMAMFATLAITQDYIVSATGKLTTLDNISQIAAKPTTKYYRVKHYYVDKMLTAYQTRFAVSGKHNTDFDMYIYAAVPVYDTNHTAKSYHFKVSSSRSTINSNNALIVLNGKKIDKAILSSINPKSIASINVLKGAAAKALFGDDGYAGAILIKTKTGKFSDTLQQVRNNNMNFTPFVWLGVRYEKTVRNNLSAEEKDEQYRQFALQSRDDFNAKQLDQFVYLDRLGHNVDLKNYLKAIQADQYYSSLSTAAVVFSAINEPFEARNGNKMAWIFGSFGIGSVIFLITLVFKPLKDDTNVADEVTEENSSTVKELKQLFLPREGFYITPIIIDLNVMVFIIMACSGLGFMSFSGVDLLRWGADYRPLVQEGQSWRLLTNIFVHGGVMHILFNMYGLLFVGIFLEPLLGKGKYILAYLGTGIAASVASIWWHPATVSIGASGAIFGMYGVFLAVLTTNLFPTKFKKSFLISTSVFIGYNLLFGLTGGIDNAAHIGGLITGLLTGYAFYPVLKNEAKEKEAANETQKLLDQLNEK